MNETLTLDTFRKLIAQTVAGPVGIAMNAHAHALIKRANPDPRPDPLAHLGALGGGTIAGLPYIIDNRLPLDGSQVFYSREQWAERCREQNEHDANR